MDADELDNRFGNLEKLIENLATQITSQNNLLITEVGKVNASIENLSTRVASIEAFKDEVNSKTLTNIEDIKSNAFEVASVKDEVAKLKDECESLRQSLDKQTDRAMRGTLVISGVPGPPDETKSKLASFLSALDGNWSTDDFYGSIDRAHRGGKGKRDELTIYVKINDDETCQRVKQLRWKKKDLFINQMRSPLVRKTIQEGRNLIKTVKSQPGCEGYKMYVNDNLHIMCKKPNTDRYFIYKKLKN